MAASSGVQMSMPESDDPGTVYQWMVKEGVKVSPARVQGREVLVVRKGKKVNLHFRETEVQSENA